MIQKEGLKFAEAINMALCVMIVGTWQMPVWSVDNLDLMVTIFNTIMICDDLHVQLQDSTLFHMNEHILVKDLETSFLMS